MVFSRIAIVNRGEAAMRLIHAVRELNAAGDGPIETVALHTEGESHAMFVREADLSYDLGPASARPYLDLAVLERALVETGADAVWVGWGFVAEDPAFVDLCDKLGVTFIGPSAEAMRKLGDKIGSKLIAEEVGVPVAPWSRGAVDTLEGALAAADAIGYPLMLKATAGGGGRGIRMVASAADLEDAYQRTSDEALARVRQRHRVPGAPGHRRPARRGADDRRRPGHRLGARRPRLLDPAPQPEGHRGVGLAAAQPRAGRRAEDRRPSGWRSPSATSAPAPSSSSTTPARRRSPSSRSTPGSRSSTRSPRSPPTSTWSRRRSTSPPAAGSRATSRRRPGTPSRRG